MARAAAVVLACVVASGCGDGGDADADAGGDTKPIAAPMLEIEELRQARACPLEADAEMLPEGLILETGDGRVSEYEDGVAVECEFPIEGAEDDAQVTATIVAAEAGAGAFDLKTETGGSWVNVVHNATGVDKAEFEDAAASLSNDDVDVLEGRGEFVAVTKLDVDDDGTGLLVVYGTDEQSRDDLEAVVESLR